jgi:hypothetical protein
VGVKEAGGFGPWGSTVDAYGEMMKWAAQQNSPEVNRVMVRTWSVGLTPGLHVKIVDRRLFKREVRVLGLYSEGPLWSEDPRTGHECWVVSDALLGLAAEGATKKAVKAAVMTPLQELIARQLKAKGIVTKEEAKELPAR